MSYSEWYFKKDSDVLFVDEDAQAVGILNPSPVYTLDVNGTINSSNIIAINSLSDYVEASNAIINTIEGDNAVIDNINCVRVSALSNVSASNLISLSNLKLFNTWVSDECPKPNQGTLFGFSLGGGVIDPSWIKTDNDFMETLNSLWNLAQSGWDIASFANDVLNPNNTLGDGIKDAINEALDAGELRVPWTSLNDKPIYADTTTKDVAMSGDIYFNEAKTLYSLNSSYFTSVGDNGNLYLSSTAGRQRWLNVGSLELFMKEITTSNITASNLTASNVLIKSNVDVPRITASNTITSNATIIDTLRVGDYYIKPNGIYVGNPAFPLTSQLVIDSQGFYKGTIDRSQVTNLEAFNVAAAGNGQLIWGDFGNTSSLNDPFANSIPLFNVG